MVRAAEARQVILTIDPGVRGCGIAVWHESGELLFASYVRGLQDPHAELHHVVQTMAQRIYETTRNTGITRLIIEYPQTYRGRASSGDTNDLIHVALVAGAILGSFGVYHRLVLPSEWKGQTPKSATEARARERLGAFATRVDTTCGKKLASNVWDAVGIGLWAFKQRDK